MLLAFLPTSLRAQSLTAQDQAANYLPEMAARLAQCLPQVDEQQPSFHGCGGWRGAVAATWGLIMFDYITGVSKYRPLVESRLSSQRISQEINRLQRFPKADSPEARAWLLRLYIADSTIYGSQRLQPMATLTALQLRTQLTQDMAVGRATLDQYGLAAFFMLEYATIRQDPSMRALVQRFVTAAQEQCRDQPRTLGCGSLGAMVWQPAANMQGLGTSFLTVALSSEHSVLHQYALDPAWYNESYLTAVNGWLIEFRTEPLPIVYGIWATLPFRPQ